MTDLSPPNSLCHRASLITTTSAATVDLKARPVNPWVLHAFGTAPQVTYPLGDYAAKTLGYKRMAIVAEDFTYGYEGAGGFQLAFEAAGGKIVQKLWPPLNAPEYAPFLAQIKTDIDGIYMGFAGSNPPRFLKQFSDFGLKGKLAVLGNTTSADEGILKLMGDEAVGVYTAGWYAAGLDTADNKKFVAGINAAYHHDPARRRDEGSRRKSGLQAFHLPARARPDGPAGGGAFIPAR